MGRLLPDADRSMAAYFTGSTSDWVRLTSVVGPCGHTDAETSGLRSAMTTKPTTTAPHLDSTRSISAIGVDRPSGVRVSVRSHGFELSSIAGMCVALGPLECRLAVPLFVLERVKG
jgi:hypothetical protein